MDQEQQQSNESQQQSTDSQQQLTTSQQQPTNSQNNNQTDNEILNLKKELGELKNLIANLTQPNQSNANPLLINSDDLKSMLQLTKKPEVQITNLNGRNYSEYENDVRRYLTAANLIDYIRLPPKDNLKYSVHQDMEVQLIMSTNCIKSIKQHLQLQNSSSAYEMYRFLNQEFSQTTQLAINKYINFLCTAELAKSKTLDDYVNIFNQTLNQLKFSKYELPDNFKCKFFFRGLGEHRTYLEPHCINENFNFQQTINYVRSNFASSITKSSGIAFHSSSSNNQYARYNQYQNQNKSNRNNKRKWNDHNNQQNQRNQQNDDTNEPKNSQERRKDWWNKNRNNKYKKGAPNLHKQDADKSSNDKVNDVHSRITLDANKKSKLFNSFSLDLNAVASYKSNFNISLISVIVKDKILPELIIVQSAKYFKFFKYIFDLVKRYFSFCVSSNTNNILYEIFDKYIKSYISIHPEILFKLNKLIINSLTDSSNVFNTKPENFLNRSLSVPPNVFIPRNSFKDRIAPKIVSSLISYHSSPMKNLWIFDTGASYNICNNEAYFSELNYFTQPYETVYSISGNQIPILGIGKVTLLLKSGVDLTIRNVKYIPDAMASCMNHRDPADGIKYDIRQNEIFLIHTDISGKVSDYHLASDSNCGPIILLENSDLDSSNFISTVTRSGLTTDSPVSPSKEYFDSEDESDQPDKSNIEFSEYSKLEDHLIFDPHLTKNQITTLIIHRQNGHPSPDKTKFIMKERGLLASYEDVHCNLCSKHKLKRTIKKTSRRKGTRIIEIISSDTSGKFKYQCLDGSQYFIIFLDHFSKMCFLETFSSKDQVPEIIENFIIYVKNQTGQEISVFRSDRGTEYVDKKVSAVLQKYGIQRELSSPDTHYQNGVAERFIRTLKTKSRILLDEFGHIGRSKYLLKAESLKTACFLYNRTPNKSIGNRKPIELFGKSDWDLNLLPFGTRVYALNKRKNFKEEDNSRLMYFVGYDLNSKAYRLYDPLSRKIRINNDISLVDNIGISFTNFVTDQNDLPSFNSFYNLADLQDLQPNKRLCTNDLRSERLPAFNSSLINNFSIAYLNMNCQSAIGNIVIPQNYKEAIESAESSDWIEAMNNEYNSMLQYGVWDLVIPPKNVNVVKSKWVYTVKYDSNRQIEKYKARLVAAAWNMEKGKDYDEVFSPTLSLPNLRLLLCLTLQYSLKVWVVDISTAYLNADIDKVVYLKQPQGFNKNPNLVCRLKKSLYGLPQSGRLWFKTLANHLLDYGLSQCQLDETIFVSRKENIMVAVYVDDILIFTKDLDQKDKLVNFLRMKFTLSDKGELRRCLGTDFLITNNQVIISAKDKILQLAAAYDIVKYKKQHTPMRTAEILYSDDNSPFYEDITTYQSIVGSLLFIARLFRPDILYAVNQLSKYSTQPLKIHLKAALKVLQYLFNTVKYVLRFTKNDSTSLVGYSDSDWANDLLDRKSFTGFCVYLNQNLIAWNCSKQKLISQSTDEAELIAANDTARELMFFKHLIQEITGYLPIPDLNTDNSGVIRISDRGIGHRTKHIEVKYLYIKDLVKSKQLVVKQIPTHLNRADIFTKSLNFQLFNFMRKELCLTTDNETDKPCTRETNN